MTIPARTIAMLLLIGFVAAGCGRDSATRTSSLNNSSESSSLDLGDDWDAQGQRIDDTQRSSPRAERGRWTIVLGTFSGDGHERRARGALQQIAAAVPMLASARMHSTESGSMLLYGGYGDADDRQAKDDLARIKELTLNNRPAFARAFLSPSPRNNARSSRGPHDLMSVRDQYLDRDPLYTLQVAVWDDFDTGELSDEQVRSEAETYARELRNRGVQAYVYHAGSRRQSLVTVGLFGSNAINSDTGEISQAVRDLMREFPVHLVNGEQLQEPIDKRRPDRGTSAQKPFLVRVPRN